MLSTNIEYWLCARHWRYKTAYHLDRYVNKDRKYNARDAVIKIFRQANKKE